MRGTLLGGALHIVEMRCGGSTSLPRTEYKLTTNVGTNYRSPCLSRPSGSLSKGDVVLLVHSPSAEC